MVAGGCNRLENKPFSVAKRAGSFAAVLLLGIFFSLAPYSSGHAFTYRDGEGEGEPCPVVQPCQAGWNNFAGQDNGYHNKLNAMQGASQATVNVYEVAPKDYSTDPPTAAQYRTTPMYPYSSVAGGYQYFGNGLDYTPITTPLPAAPVATDYGKNAQLDPGIQGAMPRYNPATAQHKFMAPKNTPADSLVDMFPWLYMNVDQSAQHFLYRGIGKNTSGQTTSMLPSDPSGLSQYEIEPSNTGENYGAGAQEYVTNTNLNNPGNIDLKRLDMMKCLRLRFNEGKCGLYGNALDDMLADTIGDALDEEAYISRSPALFARLQYDSCTNQMIIPMGLNPNYVFNDRLRQNDAPYNETWCQPLRTIPVPCYENRLTGGGCLPDPGERDGNLYDYRAWGYLRLAWKSVLQDAYTPSGGTGLYYGGQLGIGQSPYLTNTMMWNNAGITALVGAYFPAVLDLVNIGGAQVTIPGADRYGDPFFSLLPGGQVGPIGAVMAMFFNFDGNLTTINDLARQPYERIWDPTHPYSPRWDFKITDRTLSLFSRITDPPIMGIGFSTSTSTCIVRCAAVPVDVLSFRLLAFSACMGCRIAVNSYFWWMQAIYLTQDIEFNIGFVGATCHGVDLDKAVDDTTTDTIVSPIVALVSEIPIPFITYGRIHDNAEDWLTIYILEIPIDLPSSISAGCHLATCPPCFWKTLSHTVPNQDLWIPALSSQPQRNDFDSLWPICSTKYDYKDATLNQFFCATCTITSGDLDIQNGVRNCCDDVAHALAPINTLKIRNTVFNPGLKPTPEGYAFEGYFTYRDETRVAPDPSAQVPNPQGHMPYMRWWDTGTAAGGYGTLDGGSNVDVGIQDYDPDKDCGTYDTIVGVGTEDWNGDQSQANSATDEDGNGYNLAKYCRYGGNGVAVEGDYGLPLSLEAAQNMATALGISDLTDLLNIDLTNMGIPPFYRCIRLRTLDIAHRELGPEAMTSWMELKLYQARAIQNGLNCLPQYEKMHKPFGQEDGMLNAAGGSYNVPVILNRNSIDNRQVNDPAKGPNQGYYNVPFDGANKMAGTLGTNATAPGSFDVNGISNSIEMRTIAWPLAWRGYNTDPDCDQAFPQFAGDGSSLNLGFVATLPCGTTLTGTDISGEWTIPGDLTPIGNVPGPTIGNLIPPGNFLYPGPHPGAPEVWPMLGAGLGNAKPGDIVYLTYEDNNYALAVAYLNYLSDDLGYFTGTMPVMYMVRAVHNKWIDSNGVEKEPEDDVAGCAAYDPAEPNCFTKCEQYVIVEDVNNGKFPDVCGNTDMYGHGHIRTIYKEWLPPRVLDVIFPEGVEVWDNCGHSYTTKKILNVTSQNVADTTVDNDVYWGLSNSNYGSCADPRMAACTYADYGFGGANDKSVNLWNHFRIYRPTWDLRE